MPVPPSETDAVVEYEKRISASPETVFSYLTDPAKMVLWMGTEATLDPRPGGVCRVNPAGHTVMSGKFVEVDPPRRIVFTWGWENEQFSTPSQSTVVEISLTRDGEDTIVHLVHRRLTPGAVVFHRTGWHHYLARLSREAAGIDPGEDPWHDLSVATAELRAAHANSASQRPKP